MSHSEADIEGQERAARTATAASGPASDANADESTGQSITYGQLVKDVADQLKPREKQKPIGIPGTTTAIGPVGAADFHPPPSLDPGVIHALSPKWDDDADAKEVLGGLAGFFGDMHMSLKNVHEAFMVLKADPTRTADARVIHTAEYAEAKKHNIEKAHDNLQAKLKASIAAAETSLAQPLDGAGLGPVGAEIRGILRSMSPGERQKVLGEAIRSGDKQVLRAALGGVSPITTGLMTEEVAHFTRLHNEQSNPAMTRRLDLLKRGQALLDQSWPLFYDGVEKAMGAKWAHVHNIRQKADASRKALAK